MVKKYVLDTSALFAYVELEEGAEIVEDILDSAKRNRINIFISFISLMEVYYISWQEKGKDVARELITLIKSLPLEMIESNERLILSAGYIKANYRLSLADSIIAATAMEKGACLIHKDPELELVSEHIETLLLPYKRRSH